MLHVRPGDRVKVKTRDVFKGVIRTQQDPAGPAFARAHDAIRQSAERTDHGRGLPEGRRGRGVHRIDGAARPQPARYLRDDLLGSRLADEAAKLSEQLPNLLSIKNISERIPLPHVLEPLREKLVAFLNDQLQSNAGQALPFVQKMGLHVIYAASNLIYLVLIPVLSFLLIKEAPAMKEKLLISLGGSNTL